ncbi:MAG: peptidoglycan recognition family protein [Phycisphaerales bacterium]
MNPQDRHSVDRRAVIQQGLMLGAAAFLAGCQQTHPARDAQIPWPDASGPGPAPGNSGPWSNPGPVTPSPSPTPRAPSGYYSLPSNVIARTNWTDQGIIKQRLTANGQDGRMGTIARITVHHDALDSSSVTSRGDAVRRMQTIRQGHITRKPDAFADIGYHFVIDPKGNIWEGRNLYYQGAHVKGQNENNMGIMVMGNFEFQRPTPAALAALDSFVAQQMRRYNVPISRVKTHQEMAPTECPGRNLQRYMLATRGRGGNMAKYA